MLIIIAQDSGRFMRLRKYWLLFGFILLQKVLNNNSLFILNNNSLSEYNL